jgi:hypothetical protein
MRPHLSLGHCTNVIVHSPLLGTIRLLALCIELIGSRLGEAGFQEHLMIPQKEVAIAAWERAQRKFIQTFARLLLTDDGELGTTINNNAAATSSSDERLTI